MTEETVEVRLLRLPVRLWERAASHQDSLNRELAIIRLNEPDSSVPDRLLEAMDDLDRRYGMIRMRIRRQLEEAAARHQETIDLECQVPPGAAETARGLLDLLDEVDEYCRQGTELLTLASPPELVAFRSWLLGEFIRQCRGEDPVPWSGTGPAEVPEFDQADASEPPPPAPYPPPLPPDTELEGTRQQPLVRVSGDLDLATVGALRQLVQDLHNAGARQLTLDLSGVGFMDSVGLSLLVATHVRMTEEGANLRLVVPRRLRRLLELAGLDGVLHLETAPPPD